MRAKLWPIATRADDAMVEKKSTANVLRQVIKVMRHDKELRAFSGDAVQCLREIAP